MRARTLEEVQSMINGMRLGAVDSAMIQIKRVLDNVRLSDLHDDDLSHLNDEIIYGIAALQRCQKNLIFEQRRRAGND